MNNDNNQGFFKSLKLKTINSIPYVWKDERQEIMQTGIREQGSVNFFYKELDSKYFRL